MDVIRAKQLAEQYGKKLVQGTSAWDLDLFENGEYIDTLHTKQIGELDEDDFIEFYLED